MGVQFHCDAPTCASRTAQLSGIPQNAPARSTSLEVPGLRDRENPAERPVIYLPPLGWTPIAMKDGRRLYACSKACIEEITQREARDPTGSRISEHYPACGQALRVTQ